MCHPLVSVNSPHVLWSQFKRKQIAFIQKALQPMDGFLYWEQLDQAPVWGCHSVWVFVRAAPCAATASIGKAAQNHKPWFIMIFHISVGKKQLKVS